MEAKETRSGRTDRGSASGRSSPGSKLKTEATAKKASGKKLPEIYMWCGTSDFLYDQNVRMREHLKKLGYNLTYTECPGDHQWKYWDEHIQLGLNWLTK